MLYFSSYNIVKSAYIQKEVLLVRDLGANISYQTIIFIQFVFPRKLHKCKLVRFLVIKQSSQSWGFPAIIHCGNDTTGSWEITLNCLTIFFYYPPQVIRASHFHGKAAMKLSLSAMLQSCQWMFMTLHHIPWNTTLLAQDLFVLVDRFSDSTSSIFIKCFIITKPLDLFLYDL